MISRERRRGAVGHRGGPGAGGEPRASLPARLRRCVCLPAACASAPTYTRILEEYLIADLV